MSRNRPHHRAPSSDAVRFRSSTPIGSATGRVSFLVSPPTSGRRVGSMSARIIVVVALTLSSFSWSNRARGDVGPHDPDAIYYHCTKEEQCAEGIFCDDFNFDDSEEHRQESADCRAKATAQGFEDRCSQRKDPRKHLYCPKGQTGTWRPPRFGCSGCATAPRSDERGAELLAALVCAALARRRVRPRS
jgi:hypothetical protein